MWSMDSGWELHAEVESIEEDDLSFRKNVPNRKLIMANLLENDMHFGRNINGP